MSELTNDEQQRAVVLAEADAMQADLACARLQDAGIAAQVISSGTMGSSLAPTVQEHGMLVVTSAQDRDRAVEILNQPAPTASPTEVESDPDEPAFRKRGVPIAAWLGFAVACLLVLVMLVGFVAMILG